MTYTVRRLPPFDSAQGDRDQVTSVEGDSTVRITRILTYKRKMDSRFRGNDGKEARSAKKWLATHPFDSAQGDSVETTLRLRSGQAWFRPFNPDILTLT